MPVPPEAMSIISWNYRGLGRPRAVRALKDLCKSYKPRILGLIETKVPSRMWDWLRIKIGFRNCFVVDRVGLSGGLALLWNEEVDLTIKSYSRYHIDALVEEGSSFRFTLFYGNPRASLRKDSWTLLRKLSERVAGPWVVIGDFNEIIDQDEINGERLRDRNLMTNFRDALFDCDLCDVEMVGDYYTYSNRRKGAKETRVRLDRAMINSYWRDRWPNSSLHCGFANSSDHKPIVLDMERKEGMPKSGTGGFRFEPMWLRDESFTEVVKEAWVSSKCGSTRLSDQIRRCGEQVQSWNNREFGSVQKKIKSIKELNTGN